mmetsp:Transcript_24708/g.79910  ORF Transcript_24708/g.79910 Transcript_24708/m.79910 type:complete len:222 (+) Transcript_24708:519-1184(+)
MRRETDRPRGPCQARRRTRPAYRPGRGRHLQPRRRRVDQARQNVRPENEGRQNLPRGKGRRRVGRVPHQTTTARGQRRPKNQDSKRRPPRPPSESLPRIRRSIPPTIVRGSHRRVGRRRVGRGRYSARRTRGGAQGRLLPPEGDGNRRLLHDPRRHGQHEGCRHLPGGLAAGRRRRQEKIPPPRRRRRPHRRSRLRRRGIQGRRRKLASSRFSFCVFFIRK